MSTFFQVLRGLTKDYHETNHPKDRPLTPVFLVDKAEVILKSLSDL